MQETTYTLSGPADIRIALLADIHERSLDAILFSLQKNKPDLIMIAGDLILGRRPVHHPYKMDEAEDLLAFLGSCLKTAPVFFAYGNHERYLCRYDIEKIKDTGAAILDHAWMKYGPLVIGGLTSYQRDIYQRYWQEYVPDQIYPHSNPSIMRTFDAPDCSWLSAMEQQDGYKILLSHHPECWKLKEPYLYNRKIDLVLSGHAHGGQIRVPLLAKHGIFAPGQGLFPRYTDGCHDGTYGKIIISRGCSNADHRIPRIMNPPEIVYIQLEKRQEAHL